MMPKPTKQVEKRTELVETRLTISKKTNRRFPRGSYFEAQRHEEAITREGSEMRGLYANNGVEKSHMSPWQADRQLRGVHPLHARQEERHLHGVHRLPPW